MSDFKRILVPAIALLAIVLLARSGYSALVERQRIYEETYLSEDQASEPAETAEPAQTQAQAYPLLADYDATVYTVDGTALTLTQIADGKPLVINFWATWCPYCIEEFPAFQEIYNEYSDRVSFAFVDNADGVRETVEKASAWMDENGFDLPVYYDSDLAANGSFGIRYFPSTAIVNAEGQIEYFSSGVIDPALMRGALETMS